MITTLETSYHESMFRGRFFFLIFCIVLCACDSFNNPKVIVQKYFQHIYNFKFKQIKTFARGNALLEAAYVEGMISEMKEDERLTLFNPEIFIKIKEETPNLCIASIILKFSSGETRNNTVTLKRHKYRWFVETLENPLVGKIFYEYQN